MQFIFWTFLLSVEVASKVVRGLYELAVLQEL